MKIDFQISQYVKKKLSFFLGKIQIFFGSFFVLVKKGMETKKMYERKVRRTKLRRSWPIF